MALHAAMRSAICDDEWSDVGLQRVLLLALGLCPLQQCDDDLLYGALPASAGAVPAPAGQTAFAFLRDNVLAGDQFTGDYTYRENFAAVMVALLSRLLEVPMVCLVVLFCFVLLVQLTFHFLIPFTIK